MNKFERNLWIVWGMGALAVLMLALMILYILSMAVVPADAQIRGRGVGIEMREKPATMQEILERIPKDLKGRAQSLWQDLSPKKKAIFRERLQKSDYPIADLRMRTEKSKFRGTGRKRPREMRASEDVKAPQRPAVRIGGRGDE